MNTKVNIHAFPCHIFQQGSVGLIFFTASATTLWNFLKINKREEDKDKGYQRTLSRARVAAIAKYLEAGNTIPLSILISLDNAKLDRKKNIIQIPDVDNASWVIDGQHRLAGAHESGIDFILPVIAFLNLGEDEQIIQFVTINKEAKGVPTSLYYDLLPHIPHKSPGDQAKERAADIANEIKNDEDSPFLYRIVSTRAPRRGQLSLTTFVRKISPLFLEARGVFSTYTRNEQLGIINNYYSGLRLVFHSEFSKQASIFFQTIGFGALINALPTFFSLSLKGRSGFKVSDVSLLFQRIEGFDFSSWKGQTGSAAEIAAGNDLATTLRQEVEAEGGEKSILSL